MDDEATWETSPPSRGRRLTGLNVAEDVPLRTTPVMLRGGRSREPLSRQGLTWDEFLDELEQIALGRMGQGLRRHGGRGPA